MKMGLGSMRLAWSAAGEVFVLAVLTANNELIFEFQLSKEEVQGLSQEIDRYLLQGNGLLHLPKMNNL